MASYGDVRIYISRRFFENQPNEICSLLSDHEKASISSKITVKGKRKRKSEQKERRRREKKQGCTLSFYNGYFVRRKKVHLAITFSNTRLDICVLENVNLVSNIEPCPHFSSFWSDGSMFGIKLSVTFSRENNLWSMLKQRFGTIEVVIFGVFSSGSVWQPRFPLSSS